MIEIDLEEEKKALAREYKELLRISYQTLTPEDKKLIRKAFDVAVDAGQGGHQAAVGFAFNSVFFWQGHHLVTHARHVDLDSQPGQHRGNPFGLGVGGGGLALEWCALHAALPTALPIAARILSTMPHGTSYSPQ